MGYDVMTSWKQYDLFGEIRAAEQRAAERAAAAAEWAGRFQRAVWHPSFTTGADGQPARPCLGWVCPVCGDVEPNGFLLGINHGFDPTVPGRAPFDGRCVKQTLLANHARYEAEHPK
jgi:hypothetical protein